MALLVVKKEWKADFGAPADLVGWVVNHTEISNYPNCFAHRP